MFKKNKLVVKSDSIPSETFLFDSEFAHGKIGGKSDYVAVNCWLDFVDIETSQFFGGSEVYLLLWGLPWKSNELDAGKRDFRIDNPALSPSQSNEFAACFFSNEFFAISNLSVELRPSRVLQAKFSIKDFGTGEDDNVQVWLNG